VAQKNRIDERMMACEEEGENRPFFLFYKVLKVHLSITFLLESFGT